MKKLILIAAAVLFCTALSAKEKEFKSVKDVIDGDGQCSLVEGSVDVLGEKAPCTLIFDFSNTRMANFDRKNDTYEDLGSLEEFLAAKGDESITNWPELENSVLEFAKNKINKNGTYKLYIDDANPVYEMKIVFENLNFGNTALTATARMFGAGGAAFSGEYIITNLSTGEVALHLHLGHIYGVSSMGYHYTANKRMQCTVGDIFFGKYLPAVYKKNK